MTEGIRTVLYPVRDIDAAKRLYGALVDGPPVMDEAHYVGFEVDGGHVGLDPGGHGRGMTGPVAYWHVDDVQKRLAGLL